MACSFSPLAKYVIRTPIGELELTCCNKAVHALSRCSKSISNDPNFHPDPSVKVELKSDTSNNSETLRVARDVTEWLSVYFHPISSSKQTLNKLPSICHLRDEFLNKNQEKFSTRVWQTLVQNVHLAQTISYGDLGVACGSGKQSARAVGGAMRENPVILLVPCHRVLPASGVPGNYSGGGSIVKQWLLEHERNHFHIENI